MSAFKCNSCSIQFPNSDSQRYHMKTDWHRYNLKRRVAGLGPVDAAVFAEKVQQSKLHEEEIDEFGFKVLKPRESKKLHIQQRSSHRGRPIDLVDPIGDRGMSPASTVATNLSHFSLGESVYSHANFHSDIDSNFETSSEADTERSALDADYIQFEDSQDEEDEDEDESYLHDEQFEQEPLQPITSCIYCGLPHQDVETNVTHMFQKHGLYIPERSYLVDLKGLLEHLISIIVIDNECLCCHFQGKNLESIRQHTASKGHCRLPYESKEEKLELSRFYDFSSIDSKVEKSKSKKKVGFNETINVDEQLENSLNSESDQNSDDNGINDNYTLARIDPIDSQLTLPNGQRLGHRSLNRIYRQNIHIPPEPSNGQLTVAVADRRLNGGLTLHQHNKQERATQVLESRAKSRQVNRDVRRMNFQPHFREEKLQ